jgi:hypothetical protein
MNLKDKILAAADIPEEIVNVPEWGVDVLVRGLDGKTRTRLIASAVDNSGQVDISRVYPDLLVLSLYDPETREQVFTLDEVDLLLAKSGSALDRIVTTALNASGLNATAVDEAGKDS